MSGSGRSKWTGLGFLALCIVAAAVLSGLGIWQLQRRIWKLDLIARVEQRIHAAPVAAPGPSEWSRVTAANAEYRVIKVGGSYLPGPQTFVMAVTELGGGYWVMTPFRTDHSFVVLVNRGFVPSDFPQARRQIDPPRGHVRVSGLLRLTEPRGAFLHRNVPAEGRWYSRDVQAIAAARHLHNVAPYFIDRFESAGHNWPRGGLTVVRFPNNHLVYAFTWFGLAVLIVVLAVRARVGRIS